LKFKYVKRCGRFVLDYATFVKELPDSFSEIGAMLPSSPYLAKLMVQPLLSSHRSWRILEVGPGTGPFTRSILKLMKPSDELVVCEINNRFMLGLKESLEVEPSYQFNKNRVSFYEGSVLDLPTELVGEGFDLIVSSLPFHNFSPETVDSFFSFFQAVLKEEGTLTFFHYAGLRKLSGISPKKDIRERVKGVDQVIEKWCLEASRDGLLRKKVSLLNLPPAVSVCLNMKGRKESSRRVFGS
jgi:phosphatidylethanolamine/phosphatidyl-N-methylethanolamine N-methyltransferase